VSSSLAIEGLSTILNSRTTIDKHSANPLHDLNATQENQRLGVSRVIGPGTLRGMVCGIPDAENMDFEKCAVRRC
jgi:hypothetical protein